MGKSFIAVVHNILFSLHEILTRKIVIYFYIFDHNYANLYVTQYVIKTLEKQNLKKTKDKIAGSLRYLLQWIQGHKLPGSVTTGRASACYALDRRAYRSKKYS